MLQHGRRAATAAAATADRDHRPHGRGDHEQRMLHLGELIFVPRDPERLAGQDQRGQNQDPAAEAENAETRQDEHLQEQAEDAGQEQGHFQPAGRAFQVAAPEEQREADGGHEAADADARGVQVRRTTPRPPTNSSKTATRLERRKRDEWSAQPGSTSVGSFSRP